MSPAPVSACRFSAQGLGRRVDVNRRRSVPTQHAQLESTGRLAALDPGYRPGDPAARHKFYDSDVAKWLEGACHVLKTAPDPELGRQVEDIITAYGRLQEEDGYLNSWLTLTCPGQRWANLRDDHELYCAGHLMEAAVAHHQATGQTRFLDMMCRCADCIGAAFGPEPGQRRGYPGHEEIELALYKLFRETGRSRYLELSRFFLDERGRGPRHYFDREAIARGEQPRGGYENLQAHRPVREQDRAVGHAVRAMYLYSAMVDVGREDGDDELLGAALRLWSNVAQRQMYVTGSVGASSQGERFTEDYDLPEETAYCETCAAIGLVFWAQRLLNTYGEGRFADVMELALYNGVSSGVALSGDRYFYVNPLSSRGDHHRQEWFGCACCPTNLVRLWASLGAYTYSQGESAWVHLYTPGSVELEVGGGRVELEVSTDYPWDGRVEIRVNPDREREFPVRVRVPGWCRRLRLRVAGEEVTDPAQVTQGGYAVVRRTWRAGDVIKLDMDMPVERVRAHPRVHAVAGKAALRRGPVVYCVEQADNPYAPLTRLLLPVDSELRTEWRPDLLDGVVVVRGTALGVEDGGWDDDLYRSAAPDMRPVDLTAVPYAAWDNREPGEMRVWLREG